MLRSVMLFVLLALVTITPMMPATPPWQTGDIVGDQIYSEDYGRFIRRLPDSNYGLAPLTQVGQYTFRIVKYNFVPSLVVVFPDGTEHDTGLHPAEYSWDVSKDCTYLVTTHNEIERGSSLMLVDLKAGVGQNVLFNPRPWRIWQEVYLSPYDKVVAIHFYDFPNNPNKVVVGSHGFIVDNLNDTENPPSIVGERSVSYYFGGIAWSRANDQVGYSFAIPEGLPSHSMLADLSTGEEHEVSNEVLTDANFSLDEPLYFQTDGTAIDRTCELTA